MKGKTEYFSTECGKPHQRLETKTPPQYFTTERVFFKKIIEDN
jgi:hypothetical protein